MRCNFYLNNIITTFVVQGMTVTQWWIKDEKEAYIISV